ncbi:DciA family protein [Psychromonas antarctica]|uniref:DciA family protein n=1 Tax=Psychromonas antarctica TaxID=67573 RepID=UPI001EE7B684|nr:DciA family protein [Psychromonas antarctica]MCG6201911.1 DciA family protein [Psychromonas antarctica]
MNRTRKPKPVSFLLKEIGLQHDTALITKVDSLLQSYLKQHNIKDCRIGNLQNGSLLIEIPDATWLIRLKFMQSELLTLSRQLVPGLLNIKIKINPTLKQATAKSEKNTKKVIKRASKMSNDVAQSFLALAENADPGLQAALRSLAKYSRKE